jgi:hypothetical protein
VDLFVLDRSGARIGIVTEYESLVWVSRIWDHSEAHLKCDPASLPAGAAFLKRSDTDEAMLITRIHGVSDGQADYLEVGCRGATLLLQRRVNWWTHTFNNVNLASAVASLVADAQATYAGLDRTIAGMSTALVDLTGSPHLVTKQVSWGSVAEAVYELVRAAGFSFGVRYGADSLEAYVRRSTDLSASVLFSTRYADVASADLDLDESECANVAVVGGQGEGPARIVTTFSVDDGREFAEMWVDADDLGDEDLTAGEYLTALRQRGAEKIADLPVTLAFKAGVTQDRYRYRTDYDLGDTVGFSAFGIEAADIVSEATEVFESGEHRVDITLGVAAPTIRKVIR